MPPIAIDAPTLEKLISAAVAAPSIHNTQPWCFRLDPDSGALEVHADWERALPEVDPRHRALHLSIGAAVFNLRVAAAHLGRRTEVELLPPGGGPSLMATVRLLGVAHHPTDYWDRVYQALWRRHSSRVPFSPERPAPHVVDGLREAAREEGAELSIPDPAETRRLLRLTAEAEWRENTDPQRLAEIRAWVREAGDEGLSPEALGPRDAEGRMPMRDYAPLEPRFHRPPELFEPEPLIAVLTTAGDGRADWLRAGQALERVLLRATADGLSTSLLHQPLEWPDIRWQLRDPMTGPTHVQMLVRLGYGPHGRPTPRRPVDDVWQDAP